jgi:hypothetical protein
MHLEVNKIVLRSRTFHMFALIIVQRSGFTVASGARTGAVNNEA